MILGHDMLSLAAAILSIFFFQEPDVFCCVRIDTEKLSARRQFSLGIKVARKTRGAF
jgi:hypothetical protein